MKILIIEDEMSIATLLQRRLTKQGHEADFVEDFSLVQETLKQQDYHVVFCDFNISPQMDGFDVFHFAQKEKSNPPHFVFISGDDEIEERIKDELPADAAVSFLAKPFMGKDVAEILAEIES